jgi:hypothetical protein
MLRKAFKDTMRDPEFLAEAKKSKLDVDPVVEEELKQNVDELFSLEPTMITELRDISSEVDAPSRSGNGRSPSGKLTVK